MPRSRSNVASAATGEIIAARAAAETTPAAPVLTVVPSAETPAAEKPARKPRTPRKVTPPAATPEPVNSAPEVTPEAIDDTAEIARLEQEARTVLSAAMTDVMKVAETFAALLPFKPWATNAGTKDIAGADKQVKAYFGSLGIGAHNITLPTKARRYAAALVWGVPKDVTVDADKPAYRQEFTKRDAIAADASLDTVAAMTGGGVRSLGRDRVALGNANQSRVDSHSTPEPAPAKVDVAKLIEKLMNNIGQLDDVALSALIQTLALERDSRAKEAAKVSAK